MSDYISREDAKLHIFEYGVRHRDNGSIASACENLERQMNSIPAADVRDKTKGKWIKEQATFVWNADGIYAAAYRCSNCGAISPFKGDYCFNCGADMREES